MHPMPIAQTDQVDDNTDIMTFDQILQQMRPLLLRYAAKHGVALSACDDVVQETSLIAWRNLHQLRDQTRLRSWLYGICQNVCSHHLRKKHGEEQHILPLDQGGDDPNRAASQKIVGDIFDPEEWLDRPDWEGLVDRALAYLPRGTREIITLADLHELPHREAAAQLGLTLSAFEARLHRARQHLRDILRTTLRDDTIDLGIFLDGELPAEWKPSRLWCFSCGRHHLAGGFFPLPETAGLIDFRMRCPDCGPIVNSGGGVPLQDVRAFMPAMKRLWKTVNQFFIDTITQGNLSRCYICGNVAWVGFRHRDNLRMPINLAGDYWLVYDCPRCG
ncbi:MAG TPA: sigma-70 family RNA polymerase sigma factor, partial [Ktedonobacterales bacterium]|nr:sigma-70 family RNA polymerase sigma factor [Ktedonobacterales bacterium]